jgi:hypothetical protein
MTILPIVSISPTKSGTAASAVALGLTAHGNDPELATKRLTEIVTVWARALSRSSDVQKVLTRLGVEWTADGGGLIVKLRAMALQN